MRDVPNHYITLTLEFEKIPAHCSSNQDGPPLLQPLLDRLVGEKVNELNFLQGLSWPFVAER